MSGEEFIKHLDRALFLGTLCWMDAIVCKHRRLLERKLTERQQVEIESQLWSA